jgi:hypothetical protein
MFIVIFGFITTTTGAEFVTVCQMRADRRLTHAEGMSFALITARIMTDDHFPAAGRWRR